MEEATYTDFLKVYFYSGTIIKVEFFSRTHKPAYKIWVDFGNEIGIKQTSSQITVNYRVEELIGKKVIGCLNLGTRNIAGFKSQFLLTGFEDENGNISLATFDGKVTNGKRLL